MACSRHFLIAMIACLAVFQVACEPDPGARVLSDREPVQAHDALAKAAFVEPLPFHAVEYVTEALPVWRRHSAKAPVLMLLSNDPFLLPVPEPLREQVKEVIVAAGPEQIREATGYDKSSPLLLSSMAVDAALRSGWFREVVWVLPGPQQEQVLSVDLLRQQLLEEGLIDGEEGAGLLESPEGGVRGTLRGIPLRVVDLDRLEDVAGPILLHLDQGYFQQLYKNEVATPVFSVLGRTLDILRSKKLPVLEVTFSHGNLDDRIALDVRFAEEVIGRLVTEPSLFDQEMPDNWRRLSDILYLSNFFKKERIQEIASMMEAEEPDSAWVKFLLYRTAAERNAGVEALDLLSRTVALDSVYALEYLSLAERAKGRGRPDEALRMLVLASQNFPDNQLIRIQLAEQAIALGDEETALHMLSLLRGLDWSGVYHPGEPDRLARMERLARGEDGTGRSGGDSTRRSRILHAGKTNDN